MTQSVREIHEELSDLYDTKNADYGDSYRMAGEFIAMMMDAAGVEELRLPADPNVLNRFLNWGRRFDKTTRGFNGEFLADSMNHESTVDAHKDEGNYATMHASLLQEFIAEEERDDRIIMADGINVRGPTDEEFEEFVTEVVAQGEEACATDGGESVSALEAEVDELIETLTERDVPEDESGLDDFF